MTLAFPRSTRTSYDDLRRHLGGIDGVTDLTVTDDPIADSLVLRFTVLGQLEELRFSSLMLNQPEAIAHAVWLLHETRHAAVGPEFHMAAQLARRNFASVDPYGRPV